MIALLLLPEPFDSPAGDGLPIQAVFEIVTPAIRTHLQLLTDLTFALCDPAFRGAITRHTPAAHIIEGAERIDRMIAELLGGSPVHPTAEPQETAGGIPVASPS